MMNGVKDGNRLARHICIGLNLELDEVFSDMFGKSSRSIISYIFKEDVVSSYSQLNEK